MEQIHTIILTFFKTYKDKNIIPPTITEIARHLNEHKQGRDWISDNGVKYHLEKLLDDNYLRKNDSCRTRKYDLTQRAHNALKRLT